MRRAHPLAARKHDLRSDPAFHRAQAAVLHLRQDPPSRRRSKSIRPPYQTAGPDPLGPQNEVAAQLSLPHWHDFFSRQGLHSRVPQSAQVTEHAEQVSW